MVQDRQPFSQIWLMLGLSIGALVSLAWHGTLGPIAGTAPPPPPPPEAASVASPLASACAEPQPAGYVSIVRAAPDGVDVPPEGLVVRCASGTSAFVLPAKG